MRRTILPKILLGFLLLILLLPLVNMLTGVIESGKLMGSVTIAGNTEFSIRGWWDGSYQQQKEKFVNDNIGFRPDFIRITNQIDYLAFGKLHQEEVMLGLDKYLHSDGYIRALNGSDFIGMDSVRFIMRRLKYVSDTLARLGKPLIFAFTPSKARVYPETIPRQLRNLQPHTTNYEAMLQECRSLGIHTFDFNGWYVRMKAESPHPLFTRQGIHWTRWSADRAADTFNRYLGQLLGKPLPGMGYGNMRCSPRPEDGEDDIAQALNLIWPITRADTFCYNEIIWDYDSTRMRKPDVIFISDSFFWTWIHDGIPGNAYGNWEFWNYFSEIWNGDAIAGRHEPEQRRETDWLRRVEERDAVVLFFTEGNLKSGCITDFVNESYRHFGGR